MAYGVRGRRPLTQTYMYAWAGRALRNERLVLRPITCAMNATSTCPECRSSITYPTGQSQMCAECGHEWNPEEVAADEARMVVKDANGNVLQDGDDVVMIKDLAVKGAPKALKAGTKVRGIKLVEGDHNIDCRIEGFGAMALKSEFVKKA